MEHTFGPGIYELALDCVGEQCVHISGAGRETILIPSGLTLPAVNADACAEVVIENCTIDGRHDEGATGSPLIFENMQNLTVRNVYVRNATHRGVNVASSGTPGHGTIRIERCELDGMELDAIFIGTADEAWVVDCLIYDAPDTAIDLWRCKNVHVIGNTVLSGQTGIGTAGDSEDLVIIGNNLQGITTQGLIIKDAERWLVANNLVRAAAGGLKGIYIESDGGQVLGNQFRGFTTNVIRILNSNVTIAGNLIESVSADAGVFGDGDQLRIMNNEFIGGISSAIKLSGSNASIVDSNVFRDSEVCIRLQLCSGVNVIGNGFYAVGTAVRLEDSDHCIMEANNSRELSYSDVVETGTADYNRIRRNLIRSENSITAIGINTIVSDNDWWE
jgi:hypothetical protein